MTTETTPLTALQLLALAGPSINKDRVSSRSQGGRTLSYVEAYDIRATMNRIFGFAQWSYVVEDSQIVQVERDVPKSGGGTTNFRVTAMVRSHLYVHQTGATYGGVAVASQAGADIGEVSDFAMKTADSDALKRAAMNLGTQFGLSLYNNGALTDVVKMGFAPGQEWNVPVKLAEKAAERLKSIEAGEVPGAPAPVNAEGAALVERALRMQAEKAAAAEAPADDVPMYADINYDEHPSEYEPQS